jgi:hypothetical protein
MRTPDTIVTSARAVWANPTAAVCTESTATMITATISDGHRPLRALRVG